MSQRTPLEEHIKGLFDQYEPEVPEYMWDRINKERTRRPVAFFFGWKKTASIVILLGFGLLCMVGWYGWSSYKNKLAHNIAAPTAEGSIKENTEVQTDNVFNKSATVSEDNFNSKNPFDKSSSATGIAAASSNSETASVENTAKMATVAKVNKQQLKKIKSAATKKVTIQNAATAEDQELVKQEAETQQETPLQELSAPSESFVEIVSLAKGLPERPTQKTPVQLTIPCPASPNPAWNRAYFEVYGGPDYVSRQFSDTNANYARMRRESTDFRYAYSFGFRYGRVFNNGWMLKTGLNYSLLTEKFDFIQGNIINIIYVTDAAGDTISSYQTTSVRHKITYNKYRTVDVPLLMGYEKAMGRWNFSFNGGLVINLYSWNRGEVLDRDLQPVTINSGETPNPYQLKTNIGMGLQAGMGIYYGVSPNTKIFAEPYIRYNLSSMTQSEIMLKQRFHTTGMRFGIRMDFNKK